MLRTERTNDPALTARQPRMVPVSGALQVGLLLRRMQPELVA